MAADALVTSLTRPRFELVPMKGVEAAVAALPPAALVTVTASPSRGLEPTLELCRELIGRGHEAVPHLAARLVRSRGHLEELLSELATLGVREVFVPAGDVEVPAGPYEGAADLLEEMAAAGHQLERIGITGYPESHAFIPDQTTIEAMDRKVPHATYVVSQICYDPGTIRGWIAAVRARGVRLPVFVGLPGVVDRARLLRLSLRVGLGDSVRFLSKQHDVATRLLAGYRPDELVHALADLLDDPRAGVAGWHLFTFNEVERTERWRQEILTSTRGALL